MLLESFRKMSSQDDGGTEMKVGCDGFDKSGSTDDNGEYPEPGPTDPVAFLPLFGSPTRMHFHSLAPGPPSYLEVLPSFLCSPPFGFR